MWPVLVAAVVLRGWVCAIDGRQVPPLPTPQCPPVAQAAGRCKVTPVGTQGDYVAVVDGAKVQMSFRAGKLFQLRCLRGAVALDGGALPRFADPQSVDLVRIEKCAAPQGAGVSYAAALASLGILAPEWIDRETARVRGYRLLGISGERPQHFPAEPHHLDGLDALLRLEIGATGGRPAPSVAPQLFDGRMAALRVLRLSGVVLAPGALFAIPRAVRELHLNAVGAVLVPRAALARLPRLGTLLVVETGANGTAIEVAGAPLLGTLVVRAPMGPARLVGPMPTNLTSLEIQWGQSSDRLSAANVADEGARELPVQLAECPLLEELRVHGTLRALPEALLARHRRLRVLSLSRCALASLPERLLHANGALEALDLSHNALGSLPLQLLIAATRLRKLDLSHNRLDANAADAIAVADSLRDLSLAHNPLGDLCIGGSSSDLIWADADSRLRTLVSLENLKLTNTRVNRICRDWRQTMENLVELELSATKISQLTYSELQYKRNKEARVILKDVDLEDVEYSPEDYEATKREPRNRLVTFITNARLLCDCRQYWAALAFRNDYGVRLQGLSCRFNGTRTLFDFHDVPLDRLVCDASELCPGLPAGCECLQRPDRLEPGSLVRLSCENAGLKIVPRLNGSRDHAWALHLARNRITDLRESDLPPILRELDLRNNNISRIDAATVDAVLREPEASLRIGGNPLDCGCGAHDGLAALQRTSERIVDFGNATCRDEGKLVVPRRCAYLEWASGSVAVLCVVLMVFAVAALLSRPEARLRLKVALARAGWLPRAVCDPTLRFDAFVSYAHQDEAVVEKVAARLEGGRAPLRLCLHERDWAPGGWIPTQIAASVRSSRCTVALVSQHYVRSGWARAEFREARAAALRDSRPRLVVVLLDEPSALPLDEELRDYLAANTYVRWGDPWFWEKLRVALCPSEKRSKAAASR